MFSLMEAQRWSTTATGHQQGNNTLVTNKMYSLQPIHVMAGQEISGKLHLVVHRKSVGPSADKGGILHTSSCKFNLKEPYYRMSQPSCTRTTSTTVSKHVVIVDTEPELEKSEFLVMSLEKCVKQLEEERATEETYHHQQRKCKL
ncbi:probable histone-arginine methyltransferase 1.4 isoform X2 [Brassica rapa]|uniref:probable histone-arginine methyltransferase 1.4 isoform X2 n=1 Tax=Brassica campestris TaxID=3711 RepID=UPI00142DA461|nr:probable histone-arginine methyltransferase 1.4 isoform X2 [Brassica rapa]